MSGKCRPCLRKKTLENVFHCNLSKTDKECIYAVFDLVDSQKAEIERLTINMNAFGLGMKREAERADKVRAEAIKEFAEELNCKICWTPIRGSFDYAGGYDDALNKAKEIIDKLVKEMVGDEDG